MIPANYFIQTCDARGTSTRAHLPERHDQEFDVGVPGVLSTRLVVEPTDPHIAGLFAALGDGFRVRGRHGFVLENGVARLRGRDESA